MAFKRPGTTGSGTAAKKTGKFEYRPRTAAEVHRRAHQGGGGKEGFVKSEINTWTPKDGDNRIRILPPTWDEAQHFGFECFAHYSVGPDNAAFLCRKKNPAVNDHCPICEARVQMAADGDDESAKELNWRKRVAMWIIDRAEEGKGPQLWFSPWTLDQEIAKQSTDESGEALALDHPEEGYDVSFTREPGTKTAPPKYVGVKIARRASPIFDDEEAVGNVLEYITTNPIPDCLVYHDYDHMKGVFEGKGTGSKDKDSTPAAAGGKPKLGAGKPKLGSKGKPEKEELPTFAQVQAMEEEELTAFSEAHSVDFGDNEFNDLDEVKAFVCTFLEIAEEAPAPAPAGKPKLAFGKKKPDPEPEDPELPSWGEVHDLDEEALTALSEVHEVDFGDTEFDDLAAVADFVCEKLGIEAPAPEPAPAPKGKPSFGKKKEAAAPAPEPAKSSWKDKLAKFQKK